MYFCLSKMHILVEVSLKKGAGSNSKPDFTFVFYLLSCGTFSFLFHKLLLPPSPNIFRFDFFH
jgi:hypothetical protein